MVTFGEFQNGQIMYAMYLLLKVAVLIYYRALFVQNVITYKTIKYTAIRYLYIYLPASIRFNYNASAYHDLTEINVLLN